MNNSLNLQRVMWTLACAAVFASVYAQDPGLGRRRNDGGGRTQSGGSGSGGSQGPVRSQGNSGGGQSGGGQPRGDQGRSHDNQQNQGNGNSGGGGNSDGGLGRRQDNGHANGGPVRSQGNSDQSRGNQGRGQNQGGQGSRGDRGNSGNPLGGYSNGGPVRSQGNSNQSRGDQGRGQSQGGLGSRGDRGNTGRSQDVYSNNYPGRLHNDQATYNSNYNQSGRGLGRQVQIGFAPRIEPRNGSLPYLVNRDDRVRVYGNDCRRGYYAYDRGWRDDDFSYPFYVFDPIVSAGYISPWYYYSNLPGYIRTDRVIIATSGFYFESFSGSNYDYRRTDYQNGYNDGYSQGNRYQQNIDQAVNNLVDVFERGDVQLLNGMVRGAGDVNIYVDGQYSYSLRSNDYYDLMKDNAQTVRTLQYNILNVQRDGDEVRVIAQQVYEDPWGRRQSVYHSYLLRNNRGRLVIAEYGTSRNRPRY